MKQLFSYSKIDTLLVTILLLISLNNLNAQCYIPCTGSCENVPSYPSYNIVASATWAGVHRYCMGDNDLTISGAGTILTIDGPCIEFNFSTPREIVVDAGATLILTGGTTIYSSGTKPWKGIRIKSGGNLIIEGTPDPYNATIAFASNAVLAENTTTESVFNIEGASFCDNTTGIRIQPFSETMSSSIVGSKFSAPGIIKGKFGYVNFGIYLNEVKPTTDFLIGDGLQYHFGLENEFEDLKIAIRAYNSNVIVADNFIHDVGTGIKSTASLTSSGRLQVGQVYDPLYPHKVYNVIENCTEGIEVANNIYTNIFQNKIISDYSVAPGRYKMDSGIKVTNNCPHIFLNNVTIQGFNNYGVYIDNIPNADSIFINQSLIQEPSSFGELLTPTGIWISDAAADVFINMNGNLITNVLRGIELLNVMEPQLYFNAVTYEAKTAAGGIYNAYGIKLTNCEDAIVSSNSCTGNYEPGLEDVVRGIYTDYCTNFMISNNLIAGAGYGVYLYENSTEGQMRCNMMDNCNVGIYLLDIGGDVGSPPLHSPMGDDVPSENHWFPEASANRITTDEFMTTTKAQYIDWNYDDNPEAYNIPGFINEIAGTAPTLIEIDRDGEACKAFGELIVGAIDYKTALTALEKDFDAWSAAYNAGMIESSAGSWFMLYMFWKKMLKNNIDKFNLSKDLQALYKNVSITNIPLFVEFDNAKLNADYKTAKDILDIISPINDLEYYWKQTAQIYVSSIDPMGNFELSEENERILKAIAGLNGALYGPGVFYAWGMLDTIIEHNKTLPEALYLSNEPKAITIAPNPATNYIFISGEADKLYGLEIYTILGEKIFAKENIISTNQIILPQINSGVYQIVIRHEHMIIKSEKLIIAN